MATDEPTVRSSAARELDLLHSSYYQVRACCLMKHAEREAVAHECKGGLDESRFGRWHALIHTDLLPHPHLHV